MLVAIGRTAWVSVRLGLLGLMVAFASVGPAGPAAAAPAEAPCQPAPGGAAVAAAPIDDRVASLPQPFGLEPWAGDRDQLLREAQHRDGALLVGADAPACYAVRLPEVAARTVFLSPFEFLVVAYYGHDLGTRDALLQLYRDDPRQAIRRLAPIWPSPRAEMLIGTPAFFDLDANQIFVNLGVVRPDDAPNVLAHEFWHALANVRFDRLPDGAESRTTGFWTEQRSANSQVWRPVEEQVGEGVETYLMNEAVAIELEVAATGRPHPHMRPDLDEAIDTLHDLFALAGRSHVLQLYLESRSDELKALASQITLVGS